MAQVSGMNGLLRELEWLDGGYENELSAELNDLTYDGAEFMEEKMARDTGWLKASVFHTEGFLFTSFGTTGTDYAAFNDGYSPIRDRPYTITPFFKPSKDYVEAKIDKVLSKVISERSM